MWLKLPIAIEMPAVRIHKTLFNRADTHGEVICTARCVFNDAYLDPFSLKYKGAQRYRKVPYIDEAVGAAVSYEIVRVSVGGRLWTERFSVTGLLVSCSANDHTTAGKRIALRTRNLSILTSSISQRVALFTE